ncbi:uncharacterized protein [Argopecten irradians]|uniref:uncharacterized protein n=1 Tax=Argopecten irradians TaxID=31199 RepID=UPI003712F48B
MKHKAPIDAKDMEKLYASEIFSTNTSEGLQNRTIFEYLYYFCNRGRENLRDIQKNDFNINTDATGRRYVTVTSRQTKNHRGDDLRDNDKEGRMYDQPGNPNCPVATIEKYLSKLNPNNDNFWQRPKKTVDQSMDVWYDNCAVGKNTLNNFMSRLSKDAGLSVKYTNHCIRATCITTLDQKGVEARHIMGISGHKSENSIRSYSERLSENKKRQISDILSENVVPAKSPKLHNSVNGNELATCSSNLQLPDFLDDEFESIMADITAYEVAATRTNVCNNIPMSTSGYIPGNFHLNNCNVTINITK